MAKIKVFVDLDDTLIDTSKLKEGLFRIIRDMGVPEEDIEPAYESSKNKHGIPILDKWVRSYPGVNPEKLRKQIEAKYLRAGTENLNRQRLEHLKKKYPPEKYELILMTKGEPEVQEWKMEEIRTLNVFSDYLVIDTGKTEFLRQSETVKHGDFFILIDNSQEEREAMAGVFPQAELIDSLTIDEETKREQEPSETREG